MKKFTPAERRQLKLEGYNDEEIMRLEMKSMEEMEEGEDEEEYDEGMEAALPTNAESMRQVPWNELKKAGSPEMKRAKMMGSTKKVRK
jgi:hypothetical protein